MQSVMKMLVLCALICANLLYSAPTEPPGIPPPECGVNERLIQRSVCDVVCADSGSSYNCTEPYLVPKCMCNRDYVRGPDGACIHKDECESNQFTQKIITTENVTEFKENHPCALMLCAKDEVCRTKPIPCFVGPCPLTAECVKMN